MNKNCSKAIILLSGIMLLSGCKEAANTYIDEVPQTVTSISEGSSVTEVPDKVEASSDSHKSEVYDAIFNHEIKNAKASSYVVIGGYEFKINSSSYCKYFDDVGPVIIVGEQLQYRIKVQDKSYEETRDGDITAKAVNAGAIITEGPSVINSNGFEY